MRLVRILPGLWLGTVTVSVLGVGATPQQHHGDPVAGLSPAELTLFLNGKAQFALEPDVTTIEGLMSGIGPVFNDKACGSCHSGPALGGASSLTATRIGEIIDGVFDPLAELGGSLNQKTFIDYTLIDPRGPMDFCAEIIPPQAEDRETGVIAPRITPPSFGYGIVEAIPSAAIVANADPLDLNADGISGRTTMVTKLEDPGSGLHAGRFGLKLMHSSLLSFSGDAFKNENGVTNRLDPVENAPNGDAAILAACDIVPEDPYEDFEVTPGVEQIDMFTDFQRLLAPPPQWPPYGTMPGEALFNQIGCTACHISSWTSGPTATFPVLASQTIHPYTDWLLHDIGNGDGVVLGDTLGSDIRTSPLWGLRRRADLLHNGCYVQSGGTFGFQGFEPAIQVHGCQPVSNCTTTHSGDECEALDAYNAYVALTPAEKTQVLQFLGSLGRILFSAGALTWPGDDDIDVNEDYFMMYLCIDNGGPGVDPQAVNPGINELYDCRLGFDSDLDGDTDLADVADFQVLFTGEQP